MVEVGDGGGRQNVRLRLEANIHIQHGRADASELHNSQSGGDNKRPKAAVALYTEGHTLGII